MTPEKADRTLGPIVAQSEKVVVRALFNGGEVRVHIHYKRDGKEQLPLGYVLGDNTAIFKE